MNPYPILFTPLLKEKVWGGTELARLGKAVGPGERIGESWELADLPESIEGGRSVIRNGELSGLTLREALDAHEAIIMGAASRSPEGGFSLLIKYLDARQNLSVQVHPTANFVERHPETHLKSEAWYVIDAAADAVIYVGLKDGVSLEDFETRLRAGADIAGDLVAIPVQAGDIHYLPSGTLHALGAGVVVAEVQTPSDTTFRAYDWGRTRRALHIDETMECLRLAQATDNPDRARGSGPPPSSPSPQGLTSRLLLATDHFEIEEIRMDSASQVEIVTNEMPILWMVIDGAGSLEARGAAMTELHRGDTVLLPATLKEARSSWSGPATVLQVSLPSPLGGMLA